MNALTTISGCIPIGIPVAGRLRNLCMSITDPWARHLITATEVSTPFGRLAIDPSHSPERLISYFFPNVFRYYRSSDLGRYIQTTARPGDTFLDIGANLGMYSLVARSVGMSATLFEPEPAHVQFLTKNSAIFGKVLPIALSDKPGSLPLYYEKQNPGATSLFQGINCVKSERNVTVSTLSDVAESGELGDLTKVSIIKIDVEGFEAAAVSGALAFLSSHKPAIWCEVRGDQSGRNGGSYREVIRLLESRSYDYCELKNGVRRRPTDSDLRNRAVFDLLFEPAMSHSR